MEYMRIIPVVEEQGQLMEQDEGYRYALIEGQWAGPIPTPEEG